MGSGEFKDDYIIIGVFGLCVIVEFLDFGHGGCGGLNIGSAPSNSNGGVSVRIVDGGRIKVTLIFRAGKGAGGHNNAVHSSLQSCS